MSYLLRVSAVAAYFAYQGVFFAALLVIAKGWCIVRGRAASTLLPLLSLAKEKAGIRQTPAAPVFHALNGHPFAKQREAERQAAEAERAAQVMRQELLRGSVPATARAVWQ